LRFLINLIFIFGTSCLCVFPKPASTQECQNWSQTCKNLNSFRKSKETQRIQDSNDCIECSNSNNTSTTPFNNNQPDNLILSQTNVSRQFMNCLKDYNSMIKDHQKHDLETLKSFFHKQKIDQISFNYLHDLFTNPSSTYNTKIVKISNDTTPYQYYKDYTLSGPFENLNSSLSGFFNYSFINEPGPLIEKYNKSGLNILKSISDPKSILEYLFTKASQNSGSDKELIITSNQTRPPITPAIAKLILYEVLYDKLKNNPQELLNLLKNIKLKFNYQTPFPSSEDEAYSTNNIHGFTLHNGYFLGAEQIHIPTSSNAIPTSSGLDCTLVIQKCLEDSGVKFPPSFKLLSSRLAALNDSEKEALYPEINDYKNIFEAIPYKCEEQLELGDIIAFNGHAFVFAGYQKTSQNYYSLFTYEAIAGEYRSYALQIRDLYPQDSCNPPIFTSNGKNIPANIIRIKGSLKK